MEVGWDQAKTEALAWAQNWSCDCCHLPLDHTCVPYPAADPEHPVVAICRACFNETPPGRSLAGAQNNSCDYCHGQLGPDFMPWSRRDLEHPVLICRQCADELRARMGPEGKP